MSSLIDILFLQEQNFIRTAFCALSQFSTVDSVETCLSCLTNMRDSFPLLLKNGSLDCTKPFSHTIFCLYVMNKKTIDKPAWLIQKPSFYFILLLLKTKYEWRKFERKWVHSECNIQCLKNCLLSCQDELSKVTQKCWNEVDFHQSY